MWSGRLFSPGSRAPVCWTTFYAVRLASVARLRQDGRRIPAPSDWSHGISLYLIPFFSRSTIFLPFRVTRFPQDRACRASSFFDPQRRTADGVAATVLPGFGSSSHLIGGASVSTFCWLIGCGKLTGRRRRRSRLYSLDFRLWLGRRVDSYLATFDCRPTDCRTVRSKEALRVGQQQLWPLSASPKTRLAFGFPVSPVLAFCKCRSSGRKVDDIW